MKKRFLTYLVLSCCILHGIAQDVKPQVFTSFPSEARLGFERFVLFEKERSISMSLVDSTLVVANLDAGKDPVFYQYSLRDKKVVARYINGGGGKGRVGAAFTYGLHKKRTLWVHDIPQHKIVTLDLPGKGVETDPSVQEYSIDLSYHMAQLMDSLRVVANGYDSSHYTIQVLDLKTGKVLSEMGSYNDAPKGFSPLAWKKANLGFLYLKPSEEKVVLASAYNDRLEIFDLRNKTSVVTRGPEVYGQAMVPFKNGWGVDDALHTDATRRGFMWGSVTDQYIYLLYSGDNHRSEIKNQAKFIYVYDWSGNPVKKFKLDKYISAFTVADDNQTMYAFDLVTSYILKTKINL